MRIIEVTNENEVWLKLAEVETTILEIFNIVKTDALTSGNVPVEAKLLIIERYLNKISDMIEIIDFSDPDVMVQELYTKILYTKNELIKIKSNM